MAIHSESERGLDYRRAGRVFQEEVRRECHPTRSAPITCEWWPNYSITSVPTTLLHELAYLPLRGHEFDRVAPGHNQERPGCHLAADVRRDHCGSRRVVWDRERAAE